MRTTYINFDLGSGNPRFSPVKRKLICNRQIKTIVNAISIALISASTMANAAPAVQATGGTQIDLPNSGSPGLYYTANNDNGLDAQGSNGATPSKISGTGLTIVLTGSAGNVAYAKNGGQIILTDSTLTTNTGNSMGLWATGTGSRIEMHGNSTINALGNSSIQVDNGASALLDGTTVNAAGNGITVSGNNSALTANNATIVVASGNGINASNGQINLNGGSIYAAGATDASGIRLMSSSAQINGTRIETGGTGIAVNVNTLSSAQINNAELVTHGDYAYGVWTPNTGTTATLTDTRIQTSGNGAVGVVAQSGGQITVDGGTITTTGGAAHGLYASQDSSGGPTTVIAHDLDINIAGQAYGVVSRMNGANITLDDVRINTQADKASGLFTSGNGAILKANNVNVQTKGAAAHGLDISNLAQATLTNSQIHTSGSGAAAINSRFTTISNSSNFIPVTNSTLETQDAPAIQARGGGLNLTLDHTTVSGQAASGDGIALLAQDNNDDPSVSVLSGAVRLNASASSITGDIVAQSTSATHSLDLNLSNASTLTGAISAATSLTLDSSSQWNVRGSSAMNALNNSGTINFIAPTLASSFKTVTVNGNYSGNNGLLIMNTALGDDHSATDKLVITADTAGSTRVQVNNSGGSGAPTVQGIELIQVGGQSAGTFALQNRVIADIYEYTLYQGSLSNPGDGNWYLRSVAAPTPPVPPDPAPDVDPTSDVPLTPDVHWVSPLAGAYLGNQGAAVNMFTQTLHDRLGDLQLTDNHRGSTTPSAWARLVGNQVDSKAVGNTLDLHTNTTLIQLGGELVNGSSNGTDHWHLGVMAGYGQSKTDSSNANDFGQTLLNHANGKVDGYSVGAYATWYGNSIRSAGPYVDAWLQYGWFNNEVTASNIGKDSYKSRNLSGSLEAGYAFNLSETGQQQWLVEPQVQIIGNRYSVDDHFSAFGARIHNPDANGLTTRVGARLYSSTTPGIKLQPFVETNWWHGNASNTLQFNTTVAQHNQPENRFEIKAGLQAQLTKAWQSWVNVGLQTGSNSYQQLEGMAGTKYLW